MKFRFAARVITQLGAELISSDDIAVYELIKNGFDAGSPKVLVEVRYHVANEELAKLRRFVREQFQEKKQPRAIRELVRGGLETLPAFTPKCSAALREQVATLSGALGGASSEIDFLRLIGRVNSITVSDSGHGMTKDDLERCFLTIGTTHRYEEHKAIDDDEDERSIPPAGEKGIGRLSAMRLGNDLLVHTWTADERGEHVLDIDWRLFSPDSSLPANEIAIEYRAHAREHSRDSSGTILTVTDLQSAWDLEKTKSVATTFLSRFLDPFQSRPSRSVEVSWNGEVVDIPGLARRYLQAAHNGMKGDVSIGRDGRFTLSVEYWFESPTTETRKTLERTYSSADFGGLTDADVAEVGPFSFELYHYNRLRVRAIPGFASRVDVRRWLDEWSGGLMLYRDGLRVMPYGRLPDDDWLELDSKALRAKGFRVNRIQVVGCVRISRRRNPLLQDQTNREGLRDNPAATTFRRLLQRIVQELFVPLLDQYARSESKTPEERIARSIEAQNAIEDAIDKLLDAATKGDLERVSSAREQLRQALDTLPRITEELKDAVQSHEYQRLEVLELAATGMAAESLAHDLEASLDQATAETTALAKSLPAESSQRDSLSHLIALFKSLRAQITDIKPGPAKTRRRKSTFDLTDLVEQLVTFYTPRLEQDQIAVDVTVQPKDKPFRVKAVEGHLRQVLDNLLRNSLYWLNDTREKFPGECPHPTIRLRLDHRSQTLTFSDNGVGIAQHDSEWVFQPFTTHRRGGHGLGLYIAKELCEFNGIKIALDPEHLNPWKRYSRFMLDMSECYVRE